MNSMVFCLFFLATFVTSGLAIECYECGIGGDSKACPAEWDKEGIPTKECADGQWCSKVSVTSGDTTTISKSCGDKGDITEDTCKALEGGQTGTGCICEGNLCNSGLRINVSAGLVIMLAVIKLIY